MSYEQECPACEKSVTAAASFCPFCGDALRTFVDETDSSGRDRKVIDLYRKRKDQMTDPEIRELICRLHDERNRRQSRGRRGERPEWPTGGTNYERYVDSDDEPEIRTDGGAVEFRRGEYTVDLRDTEFGRVLSHGLDGLCLFMARANGGWKPLECYRTGSDGTTQKGAKHPTLSHQTYAKDVETYLEHNPETLEVAVVDLDAGDWQTVWVPHGEERLADHRSNDEGGDA